MHSSAVKVKICGITRVEDATLAAELGAWGLGFIFSDKSPRRCSVTTAREICRGLQHRDVEKVGVFFNEKVEDVNAIIEQVGLSYAQLHGTETPEYCTQINAKILKAIQQLNPEDENLLDAYRCWFLLDAPPVADQHGGTGHTANWALGRNIAKKYPLFLAGNLGADNILRALQEVKPLGADLSSSVEESPGIKDHEKLRQLFQVLQDAKYVLRSTR